MGTEKAPFIFIKGEEAPLVVELQDGEEFFGEVEEVTSRGLGAEWTSLAKVTLWAADFIHSHTHAEETYYCVEGKGRIYLNGKIREFCPGDRVIIKPGTLHAAKPKGLSKLVFWCISSPAFNPIDVFEDERGRNW